MMPMLASQLHLLHFLMLLLLLLQSYMLGIQGGQPQTSLQFALRFNTTVFSMMELQRVLVCLGHAVTALLERERQIFYYT